MIENGFQWNVTKSLTKLTLQDEKDVRNYRESIILAKEIRDRKKKALQEKKRNKGKKISTYYGGARTKTYMFYDGEVKEFYTALALVLFLFPESKSNDSENQKLGYAIKVSKEYHGFVVWRGGAKKYEAVRKKVYSHGYSVFYRNKWSYCKNRIEVAKLINTEPYLRAINKRADFLGAIVEKGRKDFL